MNDEVFLQYQDKTLEQIIVFCGDGKLRNDSDCSSEFRRYLKSITDEKLCEHSQYCLENAFQQGGYALQDIINEMGRRIGYDVIDGSYTGKKNGIGFDGIWRLGSEWILVEVKTTDAYRINLDDIMQYVHKVEKQNEEEVSISALIVAGRQDTGDLEAQIRGSKHAWSVRLVSVDALAKLMFLNSELEDADFNYRVNKILRPFEYTRVDDIIDLIFETQQETERNITGNESDDEDANAQTERHLDFTPKQEIDRKRVKIFDSFFDKKGVDYRRSSKTNASSIDGKIGVCCAVSKRYARDYQPYWYALHGKWVDFINQHSEGYFILGCMDTDKYYCLPKSIINENIENLNMTQKEDGKSYWHIALNIEDGVMRWNLSKIKTKIDLTEYTMNAES